MRRLLSIVATTALLLGVATTAGADVRPFTGSLSLILGTLPPAAITGAGTVTLNGSGGGAHVSSLSIGPGAFAGALTVPISPPTMSAVSFQLTVSNATGVFTGLSGGGGGGSMALLGQAVICIYGPCAPYVPNVVIPLTANAGATGVGVGGTITTPGLLSVTLQALAPWTQGIATLMNANPTAPTQTFALAGFGHGPASSASTTNAVSGAIRLVTPIDIRTSGFALPQVPSFAVLDIHIVPEPGTLLLLGSGVVGLAALGRRRMR